MKTAGKSIKFLKKTEEEVILDFVFENDFLKLLYRNRAKDLSESVSIDGARIFISEYKSKNGDESINLSGAEIVAIDLSNMKIGLNCIYALTQFSKKSKKLRAINLGNNIIKDYGLYCLREFLKNTKLQELNLCSNMITGQGLEKVIDLLIENEHLKTLNLGIVKESFARNNLGYEGAKCLADLLKRNKNLETLLLEDNNLDHECLELLQSSLQESSLSYLSIKSCEIKTNVANKFIEGCTKLKRINLSKNKIGDSFGAAFRKMISRNNFLEYFNISYNPVTHVFIEEILFAFKTGHFFQEFHLAHTDLSRCHFSTIVHLVSSKNLKSLNLESSQLSSDLVLSILNNLNNSNLEYLNISGNEISEKDDIKKIVHSEKVLIKKLEMRNCKINNATFVKLFEFCKVLPFLTVLDFSSNLLNDDISEYIIQSLQEFSELKNLKLYQNRFNLHKMQGIHSKLDSLNAFSKTKIPKLFQRKLNKLIFEQENIKKLNSEIKEMEEQILKIQEKTKTAEIEESNRQQNFKMGIDVLNEKIERQKILNTEASVFLSEKEKEFDNHCAQIEKESQKQIDKVKKKQGEIENFKQEKMRLAEFKKTLQEKFDAQYQKKMNVLKEIKEEINKEKLSSEFYLSQVESAHKVSELIANANAFHVN